MQTTFGACDKKCLKKLLIVFLHFFLLLLIILLLVFGNNCQCQIQALASLISFFFLEKKNKNCRNFVVDNC